MIINPTDYASGPSIDWLHKTPLQIQRDMMDYYALIPIFIRIPGELDSQLRVRMVSVGLVEKSNGQA